MYTDVYNVGSLTVAGTLFNALVQLSPFFSQELHTQAFISALANGPDKASIPPLLSPLQYKFYMHTLIETLYCSLLALKKLHF